MRESGENYETLSDEFGKSNASVLRLGTVLNSLNSNVALLQASKEHNVEESLILRERFATIIIEIIDELYPDTDKAVVLRSLDDIRREVEFFLPPTSDSSN